MWIKCSRHCSFIIVLINLHLGSYSSRTNTNTFLTNPMLLVSAGPLFFFHLPFPFLNVENIITRTPWMASISSLPSRPWQIFKTSYVSDSCTLQLLQPITTLTKINDIQLFFVTKKCKTPLWADRTDNNMTYLALQLLKALTIVTITPQLLPFCQTRWAITSLFNFNIDRPRLALLIFR